MDLSEEITSELFFGVRERCFQIVFDLNNDFVVESIRTGWVDVVSARYVSICRLLSSREGGRQKAAIESLIANFELRNEERRAKSEGQRAEGSTQRAVVRKSESRKPTHRVWRHSCSASRQSISSRISSWSADAE